MKAITVMQPWATLIARGIKTIETRPAPPNGDMRPDGVRGLPGLAVNRGERIAIHAAATPPAVVPGFHSWLAIGGWRLHDERNDPAMPTWRLPFGAVVATAVVADAVPIVGPTTKWPGNPFGPLLFIGPDDEHGGTVLHEWSGMPHFYDRTDQLPLGDFTPGRWGWLLTDVEPLPEPIPAKGKQGVWEWTP